MSSILDNFGIWTAIFLLLASDLICAAVQSGLIEFVPFLGVQSDVVLPLGCQLRRQPAKDRVVYSLHDISYVF